MAEKGLFQDPSSMMLEKRHLGLHFDKKGPNLYEITTFYAPDASQVKTLF